MQSSRLPITLGAELMCNLVNPTAIRILLVAGTVTFLTACSGGGDAAGPQPPGATAPMTSAAAQSRNSSWIPRPKNSAAELAAIQRRHYPPALLARGVGGAALVDVTVDEHGAVRNISLVDQGSAAGESSSVKHRVILRSHVPGSNRTVEQEVTTDHDNAAFGRAAVATIREMRFEPATRDGIAVTTTFRMTMAFTPQLAHR